MWTGTGAMSTIYINLTHGWRLNFQVTSQLRKKSRKFPKWNNNTTSEKHSIAFAPSSFLTSCLKCIREKTFVFTSFSPTSVQCIALSIAWITIIYFIAEREPRAREMPAAKEIIFSLYSSVWSEAFNWVDGFRKSLRAWRN